MLSTLIFTLSSALAVTAETVSLITESSNSTINGKGIVSHHEGAGLSTMFLSNDTSATYNASGNTISQIMSGPPFYLGVSSNTLISGVAGLSGSSASVENAYVTVNGSNSVFYACKPVSFDPYGYSQWTYGVAVYGEGESVPSTCQSIKIKAVAKPGSSLRSSAPAQSLTLAASAHSSPRSSDLVHSSTLSGSTHSSHGSLAVPTSSDLPASAGSTFSQATSSQWTEGSHNTTVTAGTTKYTTIECSTPTTFTYGSSTYTVSSATTLTVEDCSCTATPSAPQVASASASSVPVVNEGSNLQLSMFSALAGIIISLI